MNDWARIEEVFLAAADLSGAARVEYLDRACAGEPELRHEVEALLAAEGKAEQALGSAVQSAARSFTTGFGGEMAGPYRLIREIGRGGMGLVYLGERADGELVKQVAVKLVQKGWDQEAVAGRFLRERQILAGLEHPNIARLLDGGRMADGTPYMAMEYVEGLPLDGYLRERQPQPREKLALFLKICGAVEYAHRKLVIHRDLKPGNILVTADGEPKLLDFGIGKMLGEPRSMTQTGMYLLTPDYASPEQIRGGDITTATDVYQLGAVLYEMLCGTPPHKIDTRTPSQIEKTICEVEPAAPGIDAELDNIVLMAMRKEPERRYATVRAMAEDIGNYLNNRPVLARPDTMTYRAGKFVRRNRAGVAAAAVVAVSIAAGVIATVRQTRRAEQRFQQVRNLANTFLFDFDEKIRDLAGATAAREALVKTALTYLDSLAKDAAGDATLEDEIATAYVRVGDVQGGSGLPNLGQDTAARQSYRRAVEIRERLQNGGPEQELALAVALGKLFSLESEDRMVERAIPLARRYVERYPEREKGHEVLCDLLRLRAVDQAGSSRTPQAVATGRELMGLLEARRARFPGPKADVAIAGAAEALANPLSNLGAMGEALEMIELAITARAKDLQRDEASVTMKRAYLRDILFKADLLFDVDGFSLHRDGEAAALCREAKTITEELLAKDPENALAVIDSASPLSRLSDILRTSDPAESYRLSVRAREFSERAFRKAPRAYGTQHNFGAALMRQALSAAHTGRFAEAWPLVAQAMELRKERARRLAKQPGVKYLMLRDYRKWMEMLLLAGKREEARKVFAEAAVIADEVDITRTGYSYVQSAALLWEAGARLGDGRECEYRQKAFQQWKALVDKGAFLSETKPRMERAACATSG